MGISLHKVNSRLSDTPLLRTFAITDKIQILVRRGLTGNDSHYHGLSLLWTLKDVPRASITMTVDCICVIPGPGFKPGYIGERQVLSPMCHPSLQTVSKWVRRKGATLAWKRLRIMKVDILNKHFIHVAF